MEWVDVFYRREKRTACGWSGYGDSRHGGERVKQSRDFCGDGIVDGETSKGFDGCFSYFCSPLTFVVFFGFVLRLSRIYTWLGYV